MYRFFIVLSKVFAYLGGLMLTGLIVMTCASILGRKANELMHTMQAKGILAAPAQWLLDAGVGVIKGDYELIEAGIAFAIFAFLPLCQMTGGHASVDIFTDRLPARFNLVLRAVIEVIFAAVLVVIAVQLASGMFSKLHTGQTTFLLQFPLWWAYALSLTAAAVAAVVGVFMAGLRVAEAVQGRAMNGAEQ